MDRLISKANTAFSLLSHPTRLLLPAGQNGLLNFIPDKPYLRAVFKSETGYSLDLEKPRTYNEKLQWIKLYDRKPQYTTYADKFDVREHIKKTIGDEYLVPIIGVYDRAEDINWDILPDRFVLKCTHASGTNIICMNKSALNTEIAVKRLDGWLKKNAYWGAREWCYKDIKPRIVCEEFIETADGNTPNDYKFMCFNGEPKLIQLHHDRFGIHTLDYYSKDWIKQPIARIDEEFSDYIAPCPDKLDTMLELAKALSKNTYFARIDFYFENKKIYFGEITLYPTGGFSTFIDYATDLELGSWIKLPTDF